MNQVGRIQYSRFLIRTQHLINLLYHALLTRRMTRLGYVCEYKTHFGECHNLSGYHRLNSYLTLNIMSVFSPVHGCFGTTFKFGDAATTFHACYNKRINKRLLL